MARARRGLAIVNRSFWPQNQVVGEGLLCFAENVARTESVSLITQCPQDLQQALADAGRGHGVKCFDCQARTTSASSLPARMLESLWFMVWVMISLIRIRPSKVYVATDPPVIVPWVVALYCWLWRVDYTYHLQDIHPEAAHIVFPLHPWVFRLLRALDKFTLSHAKRVVTLSSAMQRFLQENRQVTVPITLLDNPAVHHDIPAHRTRDIVYCGNAGRLQRIPLIIEAIRDYAEKDGVLRFSFAGGGIYAPALQALSNECPLVDYYGVLPASQAAALINEHRWALLPIDDEVTQYAFPSKSSAYVLSGARVLAVCGEQTAVADWVHLHDVGIVCEPDLEKLVSCFKLLEQIAYEPLSLDVSHRKNLAVDYFSGCLAELVMSK